MTGFLKQAAIAVVALGSTLGLGRISSAEVTINGAGATFPLPLYQKWVGDYQKAHPDIKLDYQGIGSGGGIKGITDKTIDFAGSDAPMNKAELQGAGGADNIVEIPSVAGGVVPAYNIPGVKDNLKFTGELLADIYLGKVTRWNDAALTALNPGANLPATVITPVWRTDGSGTNYVFTNYLSSQSPAFAKAVGAGKQVQWPLGQGGKGNPGVAAVVSQTPGALGYLEQNYADKNSIAYGSVKNPAGEFVKASPQAVSSAGEGAVEHMKGHVLAANLWNQPGKEAYPIASFTYLIVYKDLNNLKSPEQAQAMVNFLWWVTHEGQKQAPDQDYAPLSAGVQKKVEDAIKSITYKGGALTTPAASK